MTYREATDILSAERFSDRVKIEAHRVLAIKRVVARIRGFYSTVTALSETFVNATPRSKSKFCSLCGDDANKWNEF